jgi:redox-sensitive bicupin YhaK (pirin superfamily)
MPAVTVPDWTVLPRTVAAPPNSEDRAAISVTTAPKGYEGEGFPVRRAFAGVDPSQLDPFIHMDQMGEVDYAPGEPKGTPWHPHRGFETVTYMIDGVFDHQDSHGGGGSITDGDTQWMTAGSGLLHIEAPPEWLVTKGGLFHGIQLWVNLPRAQKWLPPHYQDIRSGEVGLGTSSDAGALIRVIAGEVDQIRGPGSTNTPMTMVHATVAPGAEMTIPWRTDFNALVYVMNGDGYVGRDRRRIGTGQLAVLGHGETITVGANQRQEGRHPALDVIILGGEPIREPIAWAGPFVMNTKAEVVQAYEDFQRGKLGTIPSVPHAEIKGEYLG